MVLTAQGYETFLELDERAGELRVRKAGLLGPGHLIRTIPISSIRSVEMVAEGRRYIRPEPPALQVNVEGWRPTITEGHGSALAKNKFLFVDKHRAEFEAIYAALRAPHAAYENALARALAMLRAHEIFPPSTDATNGLAALRGVHLGEITRHFDSAIAGTISGMLDHAFGFSGGGFAVGVGGLTVGAGTLGMTGQSTSSHEAVLTARRDLLGEGFSAVFDAPTATGMRETYRMVVPSEPAIRAMFAALFEDVAARLRENLLPRQALADLNAKVASMLRTDINYVADQLSAVQRLAPSPSPAFDIVGLPIDSHAMLGAAIRFPGAGAWLQLFPAAFVVQAEVDRLAAGPHR